MKPNIAKLLPADIDLKLVLDPRLGNVRVDQGTIEQALFNLAINAKDAMPRGGSLTIETANVDLSVEEAAPLELRPGPYVLITMSDTGEGMKPEVLSHLFEPFFTTKGEEKGSAGLGLATVYGIVRQGNGAVSVRSDEGRGTAVRIHLPRLNANAPADRRGLDRRDSLPEGEETILIVEDEDIVRKTVVRTLQKKGYKILEADNAAAAVNVEAGHPGPIHLLLTDVVMPGMNGRQLASTIALRRPSIKVLYMSGYNADIIARKGILEPGTAFIEKSFTSSTLCHKVRRILDQKDSQISLFPGTNG
jgi:CheY-like chemotaxis protein